MVTVFSSLCFLGRELTRFESGTTRLWMGAEGCSLSIPLNDTVAIGTVPIRSCRTGSMDKTRHKTKVEYVIYIENIKGVCCLSESVRGHV